MLPPVLAAVLHATVLGVHWHPKATVGLGSALSLFMLMAFVIAWRTLRFAVIRRWLSGITAVAVFMPLILPPHETTPSFTIHAVLALSSYVLAAVALLYWLDLHIAEKMLRKAPQTNFTPPLLDGEKRCFRYVGLAFVLLTLTLLSGGISASGVSVEFTHKNIFAALTWLTFLSLLAGRAVFGWRGKTARLWFCIGYGFLLLSYVGSTFVLQIILQRVN